MRFLYIPVSTCQNKFIKIRMFFPDCCNNSKPCYIRTLLFQCAERDFRLVELSKMAFCSSTYTLLLGNASICLAWTKFNKALVWQSVTRFYCQNHYILHQRKESQFNQLISHHKLLTSYNPQFCKHI